MKMIQVLTVLFLETSAYDYGLYAYYRFFGPTLYDLSSSQHHGYNGLDPDADPNDSIQTDRGLYFDGVAGCATQHANYWNDPTPVSTPLMILMWVLPLDDGPIFSRADTTQGVNLLEISYLSATNTLEFTAALDRSRTFSSVSYSPTNKNSWMFLGFYLTSGDDITLQIFFETAQVAVLKTSADHYVELSTNDHKTFLGTNAQKTFGKSILYVLAFDKTTSFDHSLFLTTSCGNQCYFGTHAKYCTCTTCHLKVGACTSTNLDPLQDASGHACSTFGCNDGCDATGVCFTCDTTEWPSCNTDSDDFTGLCNSDCASCIGPLATHCATCKDTLKEVDTATGGCVCVANASDTGGSCQCNAGFYLDNGACAACHSDCATCGQPNLCLSCRDLSKVPSASSGCECGPSFVDTGTDCICPTGTYSTGSDCVACLSQCASCDSGSTCLTCSDILAEVDGTGQCVCKQHSILVGTECACASGYSRSSDHCVPEAEPVVEAAELDSVGGYTLATVSTTSALAVMMAENPIAVWSLLNTIDLLSYTPLHGIELPANLCAFFKQLDIASYFLDINKVFFVSVSVNPEIPMKWREYGFLTSNFLFNSLQFLLLLLIVFGSFLVFCAGYWLPLGQGLRQKCASALRAYRLNIFIRLYIQTYLGLALASILSVYDLHNEHYDYVTFIGVGCGMLLLASPVAIGLYTHKNENKGNINHLSSLYCEFIARNISLSYAYYTFFFIRRLLFVVNLYFLGDYPSVQISCNAFMTLVQIGLLWKVFRFANTIDHVIAIIVEVCILAIYGLLFCFLEEQDWTAVPAYIIIGLAIFVIALLYLNLAVNTVVNGVKKCKEVWQHRKEGHSRTFTHVRVMRSYKIEPEEESDSAELHEGNVNLFTVRQNGGFDNMMDEPLPHSPNTCH